MQLILKVSQMAVEYLGSFFMNVQDMEFFSSIFSVWKVKRLGDSQKEKLNKSLLEYFIIQSVKIYLNEICQAKEQQLAV